MRQLVIVVLMVAAALAEQNGLDQQAAPAANPYYSDYQYHEEHLPGPHVYRSPHSRKLAKPNDHGLEVNHQNVIIRRTYDPDYYEPTIILDYRYMKTGGRDYTRGPGGQYLILPKGVRTNEHKEFENYDAFLEHLRLKHLAETESKRARYHKWNMEENKRH